MKRLIYALPALLVLAISSCGSATHQNDEKPAIDSVSVQSQTDTSLTAKMFVQQVATDSSQIELTFTVYNQTDRTRSFCKWHTPFEPLMSKYLDITSDTGEEVLYKGPMAKRIMPPPASSYVSVKPGDSLRVQVDLLTAYDLKKAKTYHIGYNSERISGLKVNDKLTLTVK